jgi:mRNA interferase MazF
MTNFLRGAVYYCDIGLDEPKYCVVVSNNERNRKLDNALACRITTTRRAELDQLPSRVHIPLGEPVTGSIVCDDILAIYPEDVRRECGGFHPATMEAVAEGLKYALRLL